MKLVVIILFCFFHLGCTLAQTNELDDIRLLSFMKNDSLSIRMSHAKILMLEKLEPEIQENDLWRLNLGKSSFLAHLSLEEESIGILDSAKRTLQLAYSQNPRSTCRVLCALHNGRHRAINLMSIPVDSVSYYLDIVLEDDIESFFNHKCEGHVDYDCMPNELQDQAYSSPPVGYDQSSEVMRQIFIRDQDARKQKPLNWSQIAEYDALNRSILDSLLSSGMILSQSSDFDTKTISLVLHHSSDWTWNKKWFDLLLSLKLFYPDKEIYFLGLAIDRHLNLNNGGSCEGVLCDEIKAFKRYLIDKYPKYLCDGYSIILD